MTVAPASADVVVVGSGAAGGAIAFACAERGLRVVVIEKGSEYQRADYTHDELSICRRNFFLPYMADEPRTFREHADHPAGKSNFAWISCCVGGGTVHWSGFSYRFAASDFVGWPIDLATLEPYYARAEALLGVTRALNVHPLAKRFAERVRAMGHATEQSPRAILREATATRGACNYCDFCGSYGCETGAKGSSQEALLAPARATGRCNVISRTVVTEITKGADGRATGVQVLRDNGERHEMRAAVVVVAASAIESARLLLLSKLGNSSGLLGNGLMFLTVANGEATFLRRAGDPVFANGSPFFDVTARLRAGVVNFGFAHPNPIFNAEKLAGSGASAVWGKPLVERLRRHFREGLHVDFEGYSPCTRVDTNAVDLDPDVRDKWGLPVARITFKRPERDFAASLALATHGTALLQKAGADRVAEPSHGESLVVVQSGTCRMGRDARTSVVDAAGKLHDAANVYVADSAVFPTSGSVPHTLTIVANALRMGDEIARR